MKMIKSDIINDSIILHNFTDLIFNNKFTSVGLAWPLCQLGSFQLTNGY